MSIDRLTRVNELLKREIGTALFQILSDGEVDLSAITITAVNASSNLRTARVKVSIRDTEERRPAVLAILKRHRVELQDLINKNVKLKYTPRLSFELDLSLVKGDHVLGILFAMDEADQAKDIEQPKEEDKGEDS
jgi:ribosome-binding factor A